MLLFENILAAIRSLIIRPLRTILTLVGIAVGIGAVLYVVVLGEITQNAINKRLEALGTNVLLVRPGFSHMRGIRTDSSEVNLSWKDAVEIESASKVIIKTSPILVGNGDVEYQDKKWTTRIAGTTPVYTEINDDYPVEGIFFTEGDLNQSSRVCVLGATVSKELFGELSPVGKSILIKSKRFIVIGLLGAKGESWMSPDDQVFIPLTTAQKRIFGKNHLTTILAQMKSSEDLDEALFDIETTLRRNHRLSSDQENDFRVRRQDFFLSTVQEANREIADFIIIIAFVSLFVGGIGIANIMLVSVTERSREIGIRRAVGASKSSIVFQFLTEAAILGFLGGILGILSGLTFNYFNIDEGFIVPWLWTGYSFIICIIIGIAAGLFPAVRAAKADVIEAIRYE